MSAAAQTLRPPSRTLMFLEGRALSELGAFLGALPLLSLAPRGDGHPVLVLPGLVASDTSTRPLRSFLKKRGYAVSGWRQGRNLGLRDGVQHAMVDLVHELNDTHGRKISLVGWSLGGLYARQLAKMMPDRVRSVITLGSPFAGSPKATNAWRVYEMASGRSADEEDPRFGGSLSRKRRRCRPPRSSAAPTASAPGRAAWKRPRRHRKASRSRAAIAAWAIIPPWSTRWPIVWPSRKASGRRSTAAAGAAWSIPIRIGRRSAFDLAPLAGRGRIRACSQVRDSHTAPHPRSGARRASPRTRGEAAVVGVVANRQNALCVDACRSRLPASSNSSSANPRAPARSSSRCSATPSCRAAARSGSARCSNSSRRSTSTAAWCAPRCRGSPPTAGSSATRSAATAFTGWRRSERQTFDIATRHIYDAPASDWTGRFELLLIGNGE